MTRVGYAYVSTADQDLNIQVAELRAAGCEVVLSEAGAYTPLAGRSEFETIIPFLQFDDELVVTKLDRLGMSIREISILVCALHEKGASLRVLEPEVTTSGTMGAMVTTILNMVANAESQVYKDRQMAGVNLAKAKGIYKGRSKDVDFDEIRRRIMAGDSKAKVGRDLEISRMTIYRALGNIPPRPSSLEKPLETSRALHLMIENINRPDYNNGPVREQIQSMLKRGYQMEKAGNGECSLSFTYDPGCDDNGLKEEIKILKSELSNISNRYQSSVENDGCEEALRD